MSDFNDLIHDARQVDIEEIIVTKPTHYLVPAKLTPEQRAEFFDAMEYDVDMHGNQVHEGADAMVAAVGVPVGGREKSVHDGGMPMYLVPGRLTDEQKRVLRNYLGDELGSFMYGVKGIGTPIQPCADVETVGYLTVFPSGLVGFTNKVSLAEKRALKGATIDPLVRRTDMDAQVARVAAEKDAEIARLRDKQPLYDRVVHENGELKLAVARLQAQDDKALTQVIEERDECEQVISDLYHAAMGEYPEWSNNFGYRDAVEDVVDYAHALRTKALNEGAAG